MPLPVRGQPNLQQSHAGWAEVVNAYAAAHPAAYDALEELWDITQEEAAESARIINNETLRYALVQANGPKKPDEVIALNDSRLEALAAGSAGAVS